VNTKLTPADLRALADQLDAQARICNAHHQWNGANCILDPHHGTRPHWGPDTAGTYREWPQ
jgi:hypothetical protein